EADVDAYGAGGRAVRCTALRTSSASAAARHGARGSRAGPGRIGAPDAACRVVARTSRRTAARGPAVPAIRVAVGDARVRGPQLLRQPRHPSRSGNPALDALDATQRADVHAGAP